MTTTVQHIHPLATRIKKIFTLLLLAAWLAPAAGLGPSPAAAAESNAEPVEIAQAKLTKGSFTTSLAVKLLTDNMKNMRKIPFLGDAIADNLTKVIESLPFKNSSKYGKYLEFKYGKNKKHAVTIFNIGNYGGDPRLVFGFSYNGTLSTRGDEGWAQSGVWKFLPGIEVKYPVVFYRVAIGAGSLATPVVPGSGLKKLPGVLGEVSDKAAKLTRTLRLPVGALVLAGWQPKGALATKFELLNLPTQTVYLMAGAGVEQWPPGGHITGKNVDPVLQSWRQARSFARDDKDESGDFVHFKRYLPRATGYLKISIPGKWMNPMTAFDRTAYAEDAVLMVTYAGDAVSWGTIKNLWGHDEYVYAIDIPGILSLQKAKELKIPDMSIGLSTREFTLADAINAKLGMLTQFTNKTEFLRRLAVMAGSSGTSQASMVQDLFNQPLNKLEGLRQKMYAAVNALPLRHIKITNPAFVAYDAKTATYPPSKSFNIYFSASDGVTATGERGPIFIANGTFKMFGQTLGETKAVLKPKDGISMYAKKSLDLKLGKVLGADLRIRGLDETKVEIKQAHVIMLKRQEWNILGISKGKAQLDFKLDKSAARMHVLYDPTGGCSPPIPIKVDATLSISKDFGAFKSQIVNLLKGVKYDSGGITKCAGKIIEWTKDGAKYIGKGSVIAGKYIAEGANEVAGAAVDGARYTAKYSKEGAKYVKNFSANTNAKVGGGVVRGGKAVFNFAKNLGGSIDQLGKSMGCSVGLGSCSKPKPKRIASPFICGPGFHYSREYGRCWSDGAVMLAFTGAKTKQQLCLDATSGGVGAPMALRPCDGSLNQQFRTGNTGDQPTMSFQRNMIGNRDNVGGLEGKGKFRKGQSIISLALASPRPHNIFLDKQGRLYSRAGGKTFCVRPKNPAVRPNRYGRMAGWAKTPGDALDIGVSADGRVFKVGGDGKPYAFAPSDHKWHVISGSNLRRMDAGPAATLWATQNNNSIHRYANGAWQKMPGAATDIGVGGPNGNTVVAVSTTQENKAYGYMTYKWDAKTSKWVSLNGHGYRVDVDGAGTAWLAQRNGSVWKKNTKAPAKGRWTKLPAVPGGALDISAGHSGGVMVSTKKGEIYALNGKKWIKFPGSAVSLSLGPKGSPWVAAKIDATVYAYKTATSVKGWPGLPQPSPLDVVDLDNATLAYDDCEEKPVMATWSRVYPKKDAPWAAKAGLNYSFVISQNSHVLDNFGASRAGAFIKGGRHDARWPGNQEFSAVYVAETWFALYHHQTGLCLGDGRSDGRDRGEITQDYYDAPSEITENDQALKLWPCRFAGSQLWWRQPFEWYAQFGQKRFGYRLHNINTKRCMASIGRDGHALRQRELVQMMKVERCMDYAQLHNRAIWGMDKAGTQIINRAGEKATTSPYLSAEFFDPSFYLMKFPDLKKSLGNNVKKLEKHWLNYGIKEGRDGSWTFSVKSYVNRYKDLKAFATNYAAAFDHWRMNGKKEGRNPRPNCGKTGIIEFDPAWYLNNHGDLKRSFGNDHAKARQHFNQYGKKEGRQTSATFFISAYVKRHPDLTTAFGNNWAAAWNHWDKDGKKECRNPRP